MLQGDLIDVKVMEYHIYKVRYIYFIKCFQLILCQIRQRALKVAMAFLYLPRKMTLFVSVIATSNSHLKV